jgi:pimeloyl-ACP methyl ester carboxylesterase
MPITTANGTDLFYEISGSSGDPVVLVHGSWVDHHDWDAVAPLLARSHRVLAYDRRGHSRSPRPATQGSVREDADDLAALLEQLGLAPAHVVASSFGGIVALRLAVTRPDLVRSLARHEPPLFSLVAGDPAAAGPLADLQKNAVAVLALIREGDHRAAAELFVETIALGPGSWAMIPEPVRAVVAANAKTFEDEVQDPEWTNVDLAGAASFSRSRPVLISQGDRSPPLFAAVAARLAMAMPQAKRHVLPGIGHAPHLTHPADYLRLLEEFLGP